MQKPDTYAVHLRFRAGVPAVSGWWTNPEVAAAKYAGQIGVYGSIPGVITTLSVRTDGGEEKVLKTWKAGLGESVGE